jgi:hypothetical protein
MVEIEPRGFKYIVREHHQTYGKVPEILCDEISAWAQQADRGPLFR